MLNVGQSVLGRGRHVQRPYYAGWEGALPRGPLPYTRRGDITGNGEGTCCPPVQHLDRKRSPSPAPSSDPLSHWNPPTGSGGAARWVRTDTRLGRGISGSCPGPTLARKPRAAWVPRVRSSDARRLPRRGNQRAVAAAAGPVWMDTQLGRGVSALGPGPTAGRKARVGSVPSGFGN